jgi:hypothetical protein
MTEANWISNNRKTCLPLTKYLPTNDAAGYDMFYEGIVAGDTGKYFLFA